MRVIIHEKNYNSKVFTKTIEAQTEKDLFEEIYKIHNRGRYCNQQLWLDDEQQNKNFWLWVGSLSIGDYYKFGGKQD